MLLSARELSQRFGIPPGTLYKLARAGVVPSYRIGVKMRGVRFLAEEVLTALKQPAPSK